MTAETPAQAIQRALKFLAGQCDGAIQRDDVGFNGSDAQFGHRLASLDYLTQAQQAAALRMLRKYHRQLDGVVTLPSDAELASLPTRPSIPAASAAKRIGLLTIHGNLLRAKRYEYNPAWVDQVRAIRGRTFEGVTKSWTFPIESMEQVLAACVGFDTPPETELAIFEAMAAKKAAADQAKATVTAAERAAQERKARLGDLASPLPSGITLYKHQVEGVERMLETPRMIVADQMGTGKTLTALVAAKAWNLPVLVVIPPTLRTNWLREAEKAQVKVEIYSWKRQPEPPAKPYILIADEAHLYQTMQTARTKSMLNLALSDNCRACYLLTGTPIKNGRPANLFPLLRAIKHPLSNNRRQYEIRYCNAQATRWNPWDVTGAAHLDELHARLDGSMMRRTKAECLDLPEKTRTFAQVELSGAADYTYRMRLQELKDRYEERKRQGLVTGEAEALVLFGQLRQAASAGKIEAAVEMAQEAVDEGQQVVIATAFHSTAEAIASELGCERLTGETPQNQRQAIIDRFQAGQYKALVATIGAGGVGVTLHAASLIILVDRPWTPGDAIQMEDRLHRIGQRNPVTAVWLQVQDESNIDAHIDEVLLRKADNIQAVLEGREARPEGSIARLLDTI